MSLINKMGLTWEEHGSYMGGTTMKEKDKGIKIPNKKAWVDTIVYLCPYYWDGHCHSGEVTTNCTGPGTADGSCGCSYVTKYLKTFALFVRGELEL